MKEKEPSPGDGLRSLKTSNVFRIVNFELYAKPVSTNVLYLTFLTAYFTESCDHGFRGSSFYWLFHVYSLYEKQI